MNFEVYDLMTSHLDTTGDDNAAPDCTITCDSDSSNLNSKQDGGKCCGYETDCNPCTGYSTCDDTMKPIEQQASRLEQEMADLRSALRLQLR